MDTLFAPPTTTWVRLSPRYASLRRLTSAITWVIVAAMFVVSCAVWAPWWVALIVACVIVPFGAWRIHRQGRLADAWGYAERDHDLYITHGLMFRSLTVVPYGRMQAVEVSSGPLERRFGVATVKLVTASPQSDARIPGLPADAAASLRDRLSERGEQQSLGL